MDSEPETSNRAMLLTSRKLQPLTDFAIATKISKEPQALPVERKDKKVDALAVDLAIRVRPADKLLLVLALLKAGDSVVLLKADDLAVELLKAGVSAAAKLDDLAVELLKAGVSAADAEGVKPLQITI